MHRGWWFIHTFEPKKKKTLPWQRVGQALKSKNNKTQRLTRAESRVSKLENLRSLLMTGVGNISVSPMQQYKLSRLVQTVTICTCTRGGPGFNFGGLPAILRFSWFSSVVPHKRWLVPWTRPRSLHSKSLPTHRSRSFSHLIRRWPLQWKQHH